MRFTMYEFEGPDGWERLLDEIEALIDSEDDDRADAGIDFLEAVKYMCRGGKTPARQLPAILWRHLLEANEYMLARDSYSHTLYITQSTASDGLAVRALLAGRDPLPERPMIPIAVVRHQRCIGLGE